MLLSIVLQKDWFLNLSTSSNRVLANTLITVFLSYYNLCLFLIALMKCAIVWPQMVMIFPQDTTWLQLHFIRSGTYRSNHLAVFQILQGLNGWTRTLFPLEHNLNQQSTGYSQQGARLNRNALLKIQIPAY